jgi:hypothetical protein
MGRFLEVAGIPAASLMITRRQADKKRPLAKDDQGRSL